MLIQAVFTPDKSGDSGCKVVCSVWKNVNTTILVHTDSNEVFHKDSN